MSTFTITPESILTDPMGPGDTLLLEDGVYQHMIPILGWKGEEGAPITVKAINRGHAVINPGHVIGPSTSRWRLETPESGGIANRIYSTVITPQEADGDFFTSLVMDGVVPFTLAGIDRIYDADWRHVFGTQDPRGLQWGQFLFDPADRRLYVCHPTPFWRSWQLGTHNRFKLEIKDSEYVTIDGIDFAGPNRMTAQQWGSSALSNSKGIIVRNCRFLHSDHKPLTMNGCEDCIIEDNEIAYGGSSCMTVSNTTNCTIQRNWLHGSGFRAFIGRGIQAAIKAIPGNVGLIIEENLAEDCAEHGFWLDSRNQACISRANVARRCGTGFRWELESNDCVSVGDVSYDNSDRGFYVNARVEHLIIMDAVCVRNGQGVVFKGDVSGGSQIIDSIIADNRVMDVYIPKDAAGFDCNHNRFGKHPKVGHPWGKPLPLDQWPYDADSDFSGDLTYTIGKDGLIL